MLSRPPVEDRSGVSRYLATLAVVWAALIVSVASAGTSATNERRASSPDAPASLSSSPSNADDQPPSAEARTLYTLGQLISRTLDTFALTSEELKWVKAGIEDGVLKRDPKVDLAAEADGLHKMQDARRLATVERERQAGLAFIAAMANAPGSKRHPSGLVLQPLSSGVGEQPDANDHVRVHYEGRLIDGTVFESSRARGTPATLPVRGVLPCWSEALQAMRVGDRSRVVCPAELAYGERGAPPVIKPGATLVFDIELLGVVR
jgi:FKBP-type peptidyl-prolyl cis-trans isomerase FkpA/FKBP-type peptidyl-prolyl cis-trans isomerase FklB